MNGPSDTGPPDDSGHGADNPTTLAPPGSRPGDDRFVAHLATAGELVAAKRYREAEVEVLRALSGLPADLRALNLLALVRFKLGRLEEARATYREIAAAAPNDATARRNLGLLALKLERLEEAIPELEMAARLAPVDQRAWSYLGYAYAKRGEAVAAAAAFRRAGQDALATELEHAATARRPPTGPSLALASAASVAGAPPATVAPPAPAPQAAVLPPAPAPEPPAPSSSSSLAPSPPLEEARPPEPDESPTELREQPPEEPAPEEPAAPAEASGVEPVPLVAFVLSRLGLGPAPRAPQEGLLRLQVPDEIHLRADAVLVGASVRCEPAFRRVQGRRSGVPLGAGGTPFFRAIGPGEVWLAGTSGRWQALSLDDDVLYVREDRVLAFDGSISWEAGAIPGEGLRMLQFRGRGCVVLQLDHPPAAVKVTEDRPALIASARLFGWVGRLVAHKQRSAAATPFQLLCQGDGVVMFDLHHAIAANVGR